MSKNDNDKDKPSIEVSIDITKMFDYTPLEYVESVDFFYSHVSQMSNSILDKAKENKMVFVIYDDYDNAVVYLDEACDYLTSDIERSHLCLMEQWPNESYESMKLKFVSELNNADIWYPAAFTNKEPSPPSRMNRASSILKRVPIDKDNDK